MRLQAAARRGALTPALPMPYPALENAGLRLRRGQLSLTVAAPSVGKSQLWHNLAHRMGVPTMYWSADTDSHDVLIRATALWTQHTTEQVEQNNADPAWRELYAAELEKRASHIEWVFDSHITPKVVKERLAAFATVHGEHPHLCVVDNLSNTVENQSDAFAEQSEVMAAMQNLARETGAHVAVLSHAKGQYEDGDKPIPMGGSQNNQFRIPEIGLTLHKASRDGTLLGVNIVKNRGGRSDQGANFPIHFEVDWSRATVKNFRVAA